MGGEVQREIIELEREEGSYKWSRYTVYMFEMMYFKQ